MIPCPVCHCATKHGKRRPRAALACNPAKCWQWDHDCYAKRMRSAARRTLPTATTYIPAMIGGRIVPNATISEVG